MHHKLPHKKTDYGNAISFPFFNGHNMESLSAINLYGQLMTLTVLCMVIHFFVFLAIFFGKQISTSCFYSFEEFKGLENFQT